MRVTKQPKYAIYGVSGLAYNCGERPILVKEIILKQWVTTRYLEQIFQQPRGGQPLRNRQVPEPVGYAI